MTEEPKKIVTQGTEIQCWECKCGRLAEIQIIDGELKAMCPGCGLDLPEKPQQKPTREYYLVVDKDGGKVRLHPSITNQGTTDLQLAQRRADDRNAHPHFYTNGPYRVITVVEKT